MVNLSAGDICLNALLIHSSDGRCRKKEDLVTLCKIHMWTFMFEYP